MKIAELKRLSEAASVRGTEQQDTAIAAADQPWHKHRWVRVSGAAGIALVTLVAWLIHTWSNSSHVIAGERLRIATVSNGRFVRDVAAQGTVIAAVNPTMFAVAPGTVSYLVRAGDNVTKGQVLATLESPELNNEYQREHATLDSLNASGSGQAKLLRVLQTGEFERLGSNTTRRTRVRVIAATNANLRSAIREGRFREDLFYRLNVIELEIPALAERREDIAALARHFLEPGFTLAQDAVDALIRHPWPGNVRELQNTIRRACLLSSDETIAASALVLPVAAAVVQEESALDRGTIEQALGRAQGVVAQAARELGLSRQALYRRMEKLGLRSS